VKNADKYISEPPTQSCLVMPRSAAKAIFTGPVAGEVGGSAARAASDTVATRVDPQASPLASGSASLGLLALTADEVVLLKAAAA
jgi:hypothetical protein